MVFLFGNSTHKTSESLFSSYYYFLAHFPARTRIKYFYRIGYFPMEILSKTYFIFLYFLSYLFIYFCIQNMYNLVLFTIIYVDIFVTYFDLYFILISCLPMSSVILLIFQYIFFHFISYFYEGEETFK